MAAMLLWSEQAKDGQQAVNRAIRRIIDSPTRATSRPAVILLLRLNVDLLGALQISERCTGRMLEGDRITI